MKPRARNLLSKMRKLLGHFNHSECSVAVYNTMAAPHTGPLRGFLNDVLTGWSSMYRTVAFLYTCHARLNAVFTSSEVGAGPGRRSLSTSEWDRLRQRLDVLRDAFYGAKSTESGTDPLLGMMSLAGSL